MPRYQVTHCLYICVEAENEGKAKEVADKAIEKMTVPDNSEVSGLTDIDCEYLEMVGVND